MMLAAALALGAYAASEALLVLGLALWMLMALRVSRRVLAMAGLCFVISAVRVQALLAEAAAAQAHVFASPGPRRCVGTGMVTHSAQKLGADVWQTTVRAASLECAEVPLAPGLHVRLYGPGFEHFARGDTIEFFADLAPFERFANGGDVRIALARHRAVLSGTAQGVHIVAQSHAPLAWMDHLRSACRIRIEATFPERSRGFARALVLGDALEDRVESEAFQRSGLSHLLAVSGAHLVVVVLGVLRLLRFGLLRTQLAMRYDLQRLCAWVGVPFSFVYADFAGGSGSAMRAAWMTSVGLLCFALGRRLPALHGVALSCMAMLGLSPMAAFDLSFVLSVAATLGLIVVAPHVAKALTRFPAWIRTPLATSVACSLTCAPVLATLGAPQSLLGVLANVLAVPVGEWFCLPLSLLQSAAFLSEPLQRLLARTADSSLALLSWIAHLGASAGGFEWPVFTALELVVLTGAVLGPGALRTRIFGALVILTAYETAAHLPPRELVVTHLDVGQGDATLVQFPNGKTMLIDAGGLVGGALDVGAVSIRPALRARRIRRIDVVVLSHPHPDHFGGFAKGLEGIAVGEVWHSGKRDENPFMRTFEAWAHGRQMVQGEALCRPHAFGDVDVTVLAPCPAPEHDWGANDNSLVLRITYGARRFLFVGDAEEREEGRLLETAQGSLGADVLKVGHHGSRTSSSPAFLAAVHPKAAVVSSGIRNRFNHPHPNTIANFASVHVPMLRIDQLGSVTWHTDGHALRGETILRCFGGYMQCTRETSL